MSGEDASCVILPLAAIEVHLPKSEICEFPLISISFSTIILYFEYLKCYLQGLIISRLHDRLFEDVKIDILTRWGTSVQICTPGVFSAILIMKTFI